MILCKEGFKEALRKADDYKDNPYADLDMVLSDLPIEERKKRKEEYFFDLRIMKATSIDEVSDITFEQVLECISSSNLFADLFEKQKAKYYLQHFEKIRSVCSRRKRRVL